VLRLDAVHPVISGNKWFKLKGYLAEARRLQKTQVLTFGGAYSNHILATAALCTEMGLSSIGIIRGERPSVLSPTLREAQSYSMKLCFVSRESYRSKEIPAIVQHGRDAAQTLVIAEGGYGAAGAKGIEDLFNSLELRRYSHIIAATGTGTTLGGIVAAAGGGAEVIGISPFRNNHSLGIEINELLPPELHDRYRLLHDFHFGGYAKYTAELILFMNQWYRTTGVPSDIIYTSKMFYALNSMLKEQKFGDDSHILAVHTGGLQGNRSLEKGTLIFDDF
jgi:1-aminocyclopropane-1-carboxylate deaminase